MKRFNTKYAPFWYHPDHLGSSSYITNLAGEINQHLEYLPFGELLVEEHLNSYNSPFKFNAKEFDAETGNYYYGARYYDPKTSLMLSTDRFKEKYPSFSPYNYAAQNPIKYLEINGDSVRVAQMAVYDEFHNTNHQQHLANDWQQQTGLTLNVDSNTGIMSYATDAKGNPIISTITDANGNTIEIGSASARADLISYIDGKGVIDIGVTPNDSATPHGENQIWLGESQINSFIGGTPTELNDKTLGFGMTAFHELGHTEAGGSNSDPTTPGSTATGPVVDRVNIYRQELDNSPANAGARPYGQRRTYQATPSGNNSTLRFRYQTINRKGKTVNRSRNITF